MHNDIEILHAVFQRAYDGNLKLGAEEAAQREDNRSRGCVISACVNVQGVKKSPVPNTLDTKKAEKRFIECVDD